MSVVNREKTGIRKGKVQAKAEKARIFLRKARKNALIFGKNIVK